MKTLTQRLSLQWRVAWEEVFIEEINKLLIHQKVYKVFNEDCIEVLDEDLFYKTALWREEAKASSIIPETTHLEICSSRSVSPVGSSLSPNMCRFFPAMWV